MKRTLIILNLLAAVLVFPAMGLVHQAQIMRAALMYTELDRAQVIDREQLEQIYPEEAGNDRYLIAKRYMEPRKDVRMIGYPCIVGFVLNAILIGCFTERKGKQDLQGKPAG